jgi:MFS family permease
LMVPWEQAFGWSRQTISFAAACGIFLFGLTGPFAAAAMQRFGIRATVIAALAMMGLSSAASLFMTQSWQLVLSWGVFSGIGSGCITNVLSATIVNRWFVTNRGLVMGLFAASTSTGTLVFIPVLSAIAQDHGWQPVVICVAGAMALLIPVVFFLLPEWPADVGQVPFGADPDHPPEIRERKNPLKAAFSALGEGVKSRPFWLLAITFFVCGFTTNGLVGTHMIALCHDHGMEAVAAGGLLAIMGLFDLVGTTASGWLTDRIDPRKLLFAYYVLRPGLDRHRAADPGHRQQGVRHQEGAYPVWLDFGQPPDRGRQRRLLRRCLAHRHRVLSGLFCHSRLRGGGCRLPGPDDQDPGHGSRSGGSLGPAVFAAGRFSHFEHCSSH